MQKMGSVIQQHPSSKLEVIRIFFCTLGHFHLHFAIATLVSVAVGDIGCSGA